MNDAGAGSPPSPEPGETISSERRLVRAVLGPLRARWSVLSIEGRVLLAGIAIFVALTATGSYLRYLTFQTNAWDLGINMQVLWTTAFQGRFLYYTAELSWNSSGSLMGVHFVPILFALVPIYRLLPYALTLFLIQSLAVGGGAVPLYLLGVRRTNRRAALLITFAYLVSAPILGAIFFDFHAEAFIPLAGLSTWYAWETRRPALLGVSATALLAVIEFTPLILGAIALMFLLEGAWGWWHRPELRTRSTHRWSIVLPAVVLALSAVLLPIWFLVPKLVAPSTPPYGQTGALGGSLSQIFRNLVNPSVLASVLAADGLTKVAYVGVLLGSGLVLWVLRPVQVLPAVPWLMVVLLTPASNYHVAVGNQYLFLVVPFLFPATASGYQLLATRLRAPRSGSSRPEPAPPSGRPRARLRTVARAVRRYPVLLSVAVVFLAGQVAWSPLSPVSASWENVYELPDAHTQLLSQVESLVPARASVSAQPNLFPPFANRADAFPYVAAGVQYVFCDVSSGWFSSILPPPARNPSWDLELRTLPNSYRLEVSRDGALLFESNYSGAPEEYSPWNASPSVAGYSLERAHRQADASAPFGNFLVATGTDDLAWTSPLVGVAPGNYSLTVWVRTLAAGGGPLGVEVTYDHNSTELQNTSFSPTYPANTWTPVRWNFTFPYASTIELNGYSGAVAPGVEFGGFTLAELSYWG